MCVEKLPGGRVTCWRFGAESSYTVPFWDLLHLTGLADGLETEPLISPPSYPITAPIAERRKQSVCAKCQRQVTTHNHRDGVLQLQPSEGVAHPKIIILSLFTHPLVFPNLNAVIFLWNRKVEVFEESLHRQQQFIVITE